MEHAGPLRKLLRKLNNGLLIILKPLQIVNNFLFLTIAYFIGVGISSLLYRLGPGKKIGAKNSAGAESPVAGTVPDTYWRKLPQVSRDRNAWMKPF